MSIFEPTPQGSLDARVAALEAALAAISQSVTANADTAAQETDAVAQQRAAGDVALQQQLATEQQVRAAADQGLADILIEVRENAGGGFADAAEAAATLAGHYANDDTDTDVPGGAPGERGIKYYHDLILGSPAFQAVYADLAGADTIGTVAANIENVVAVGENIDALTGGGGALAVIDDASTSADKTWSGQKLTSSFAAKEPLISTGTSAQYVRGDKALATLNKAAVGLGNVDNTADTAKPVSTLQQAAIDLKAPLASPQLSGTLGLNHMVTAGELVRIHSQTAMSGTVSCGGAGFNEITGVNTKFNRDFRRFDVLVLGSEQKQVVEVISNTSMTTEPFTQAYTDQPCVKADAKYWTMANNGCWMPSESSLDNTIYITTARIAQGETRTLDQGAASIVHNDIYASSNYTFAGTGSVWMESIFWEAKVNRTQGGRINGAAFQGCLTAGGSNVGGWDSYATTLMPAGVGGQFHSSSGLNGCTFAAAAAFRASLVLNSGQFTRLYGYYFWGMANSSAGGSIVNGIGIGLHNINAQNKCYALISNTANATPPTGNYGIYDESGYDWRMSGALYAGSLGVITAAGVHQQRQYTIGTLPAATTAGQTICITDAGGGAAVAEADGASWRRIGNGGYAAKGDADATLYYLTDAGLIEFGTALTANRTATIATTLAHAGARLRILRTGLGAYTLAIVNGGAGGGTLFTFPASSPGAIELAFDGTNWKLAGAAPPKQNLAAGASPGSANDCSQGYGVGSLWLWPASGRLFRCRDATAGSAQWAELDLADHPGYISSYWYQADRYPIEDGSAPGANQLCFVPFTLESRVTLSDLGARIATAGAGGNLRLMIYALNAATGNPTGTPLAQTGSISSASTGPVNGGGLTGGNATLEPGTYFAAWITDSATAAIQVPARTAHPTTWLLGDASQSNLGSSGTRYMSMSYAATFGAGPDMTSVTPLRSNVASRNGPALHIKIA